MIYRTRIDPRLMVETVGKHNFAAAYSGGDARCTIVGMTDGGQDGACAELR